MLIRLSACFGVCVFVCITRFKHAARAEIKTESTGIIVMKSCDRNTGKLCRLRPHKVWWEMGKCRMLWIDRSVECLCVALNGFYSVGGRAAQHTFLIFQTSSYTQYKSFLYTDLLTPRVGPDRIYNLYLNDHYYYVGGSCTNRFMQISLHQFSNHHSHSH